MSNGTRHSCSNIKSVRLTGLLPDCQLYCYNNNKAYWNIDGIIRMCSVHTYKWPPYPNSMRCLVAPVKLHWYSINNTGNGVFLLLFQQFPAAGSNHFILFIFPNIFFFFVLLYSLDRRQNGRCVKSVHLFCVLAGPSWQAPTRQGYLFDLFSVLAFFRILLSLSSRK